MSGETDRELLELAAKAAGIRLHVWGTRGAENFADLDATGERWNPLIDDGDALRLAVKLGITIEFDEESAWANGSYQLFEWAEHNGDARSATRRAIVRAAAAIAKGAKS